MSQQQQLEDNDTKNVIRSGNNAASKQQQQFFWMEPGIQPMPDWISQYAAYHRAQLQTTSRQQGKTKDPPVKFLQWTCQKPQECGGLGDRLYGIVMTFYIALFTNRTFLLDNNDWQVGATDGSRLPPMTDFVQPALVSWDASATRMNIQNKNEPSKWNNLVKITDNRQHPLLLDPCRHGSSFLQGLFANLQTNIMTHDPVLLQSSCFDDKTTALGDWARQSQRGRRSLFHLGFWTLFRFTDLVHQQARELLQLAGMKHDRPYIAVHVRTGQGETFDDPLRHHGETALRQFQTCALRVQRALRNECHMPDDIYVAADNNYVKARMASNIDKATTTTTTTVMNSSASFFKSARDIEVLHIGKSRWHELENGKLAYQRLWGELQVLMASTCLVMSRSKFSYMGSELSPQQPRCAVMFDECEPERVAAAVKHVAKCQSKKM